MAMRNFGDQLGDCGLTAGAVAQNVLNDVSNFGFGYPRHFVLPVCESREMGIATELFDSGGLTYVHFFEWPDFKYRVAGSSQYLVVSQFRSLCPNFIWYCGTNPPIQGSVGNRTVQ